LFVPNRSWCSATNDVPRDGVQPFVQLVWPTTVDVREVRFGTNVSATDARRITSAEIELRSADGALVYTSGPIGFEPPGPVHVLPEVARDVAIFRLSVISHGGGASVCVPSIEIVGAATDPAFSMPDLTAPSVLDIVPAQGAIDVPVDSRVVLTFDEPLDPTSVSSSSIRVTYYDGGDRSLNGSYRTAGPVVTFVPDHPLPSDRSIEVYVSSNSVGVQDLAGNRMTSSRRYRFQTGDSLDDVPPVLVSSTPADGATGVNPGAPVLLAFSEPLNAGTLYSKIRVTNGSRSEFANVGHLLPGAREIRIDPSFLLAGPVTVSIAAGVTDLAGNPLAPLTLSFTAETRPAAIPPTVTAIRPPAASVQAPDTSVVVYLDMPIDPATVDAGLLVAEDGVLVDGTISIAAGPATLVFQPEQPFRDGAIVEVFVLPSLLSLSGTPAAEAYGWFGVEDPAVRAPVVTDRSTVDPWNQMDSRRFLAVRYSTPLDPSSVSLAGVLIDGTAATGGTVGLGPDGRTLVYRTAPGVLLPGFYFSVGLTGLQTADGRPVPDLKEVWYGSYDDVVAPTATTITSGSTGSTVPRTATFDIDIGETFDPTSVHAGTIRLIGPSGPVPIDAFEEVDLHDAWRIRITPHGPLLHDTPYTVVVDGVRDAGGNPAPAASADFLVAPAP
jgi:hypothetical protein